MEIFQTILKTLKSRDTAGRYSYLNKLFTDLEIECFFKDIDTSSISHDLIKQNNNLFSLGKNKNGNTLLHEAYEFDITENTCLF